jgi:hypothetical protein
MAAVTMDKPTVTLLQYLVGQLVPEDQDVGGKDST